MLSCMLCRSARNGRTAATWEPAHVCCLPGSLLTPIQASKRYECVHDIDGSVACKDCHQKAFLTQPCSACFCAKLPTHVLAQVDCTCQHARVHLHETCEDHLTLHHGRAGLAAGWPWWVSRGSSSAHVHLMRARQQHLMMVPDMLGRLASSEVQRLRVLPQVQGGMVGRPSALLLCQPPCKYTMRAH